VVEIPGFDSPGAARRVDGARQSRTGDAGRTGRSSGDANGAESVGGDQPALSDVARRHLREGASRLHEVGTFAPITDADDARAAARALSQRLRVQPDQAERAQANLSPASVLRALA
jgi:hypothetical protein